MKLFLAFCLVVLSTNIFGQTKAVGHIYAEVVDHVSVGMESKLNISDDRINLINLTINDHSLSYDVSIVNSNNVVTGYIKNNSDIGIFCPLGELEKLQSNDSNKYTIIIHYN